MTERDKKLIEQNWDRLDVTLKSLVARFNICREEAEDYCQTGLLTLCSNTYKYDGSTQFTTFANKVITNAFIDKFRREKQKNSSTVSLDEICSEDDCGGESSLMNFLESDDNTENKVIEKITKDMIRKYIRDVKEKCTAQTTVKGFEALELKLDGYSGEDIAKMFEVPSNSVRSWISRAKKLLMSECDFVELVQG